MRAVLIGVAVASLASLASVGCRRRRDPAPPSEPAAARSGPAKAGDQYELARQLETAERADDVDAAFAALRSRWQSQRIRWRVFRIPALCQSADACHVLPFDRAGADTRIIQGWMPELTITPTELAVIVGACGDRSPCPITIEATLSRLTAGPDRPTSIQLSSVEVAM